MSRYFTPGEMILLGNIYFLAALIMPKELIALPLVVAIFFIFLGIAKGERQQREGDQ